MKTMIATQGDLQSVWKEKIKNQFDSMLNDCFKEQNNSLTKAASQFYKLNDTGLNEITEFGKMLKTNIITQLEEVDKIKTESTVTSEFITEKWTEHHNVNWSCF